MEIFLIALAAGLLAAQTPNLILSNGKIWTGVAQPAEAQAVACGDGKILAVGSSADIRKLAGPATRVVDLRGQLVVPGFNDAHVHFFDGGTHLASVQLRDTRSAAEFRDRIAAFAAKIPQGQWITGGDWDHENWTPARLPTRLLIDAASSGHPVFVNRLDGHMSLANSLALRIAGVSSNTADPPGGVIVRDESGELTGILKDSAQSLIRRVMPAPTPGAIANALKAAMRYAAQNGVTSIQDMSASPDVLRGYQDLLAAGELRVRVYGAQPLGTWQRLAGAGIRAAFGDDKLKIGILKGFADGSLGSTTALLFEPYLDAPGTSGLASDEMIPESAMFDRIAGADAAGLQIAIHAIGDRANRAILDLYARAAASEPSRDRRFRIEHAQHLTAEDISRFGRQRVIASMQPYHLIDDGRWAEKRIGPERAKGAYAFRSLIDSGAVLAFGSDWHVAPMEPILGIYAAVTRRTLDGKHPGGWVPEQKITVAEAVRAYTMGAAYASFDEKIKGSIEPGKLADLAVLSDDIFTIDPAKIDRVKVVMTVFDGRVVYER